MAAVGLPGGHAPNRVTEFVAPNPLFSSSQLPNGCAFVSNANTPQIADYGLVAGIGFFVASAITPQGQANAAEYTFGLHAQAIYQAEGAKSSVWKSVPTPPAVAQPVPQRFIWGAPQSIDLTLQGSIQPSAATPPAAAQPAPLRLIFASQEPLDLSIGAWVVGGTQANQGPVPAAILTLPQDTTQLAAQIWKSQPAAVVITPNPAATFFSVPPQFEDRPTRAIWQSLRAGQTPPIIPTVWAAPQSVDLTQQGSIFATAPTPPAVGPVPPFTSGAPQPDPTQLAPQVWPSVPTPPAIVGVTVWPNAPVPPQFDPSPNPSVVWTPSTFSPSAPPVADTGLGGSSARHPRRVVYEKGDKRKPKTFIDKIGEPFVLLEDTAEPVPDAEAAGYVSGPVDPTRVQGALKARLPQFILTPEQAKVEIKGNENPDDEDDDILLLS